MKNISRLLALCIALLCVPFAYAGSLGAEKIISTDPSMGSQFPEVAYYNGIVHVVWEGYAPGVQADVFYSRSTDNGVTFSVPVNLSASATAAFGSFRPQVTAGPNGVFVGWNSEDTNAGGTGEVYVARSTNSGQTFGTAAIVAGTQSDGFYARITQLFTDSGGRVHLAYYENKDTSGVAGMIHHRMNCTGSTWSTDVAVTNRTIDGDVDNEQPRISEAGGKLQIVFRSSRNGNPQGGWPPYSIQMQTGTVNTGTCTTAWSYPARRIGGGIPFTYASTYRPEAAGDASGNVHVAYWDNTAGANVYYRRGNTSAGILGAPQKMSSFTVDHLEPGGISSTAAQVYGGFQVPPALATNGTNAYIAYQKHQQVSQVTVENGPIYLRESADNGTTWGIEQAISTFGTATTPRIAIGGTGNKNVAIVYSDMRSSTTARVALRMYNAEGASFEQNVASVVTSYYQTILGRTPDAAGLAFWTAEATRVVGLGADVREVFYAMAMAFFGSTEYAARLRDDTGYLTDMYVTFFARNPDAAGLAYWQGELNAAQSRSALLNSFLFSTEYSTFMASLFGTTTVRPEINMTMDLFRGTFGRLPDSDGFNFWLGRLRAAQCQGASAVSSEVNTIAGLFFNSGEYVGRLRNDRDFMGDVYNAYMRRGPGGDTGFSFWVGQVPTRGRDGVRAEFVPSTEFQARVSSVIAGGCLP